MKRVTFINKSNLRIARENVGMTTIFVSRKFNKSDKDIVSSWEKGEILPTWRQIDKLAKIYNVSLLILFSGELIKKNKIIPDYRVKKDFGDSNRVKKLVNFIIRRQEWLARRLKEDGEKNTLQGSGKNLKTPKQLANFIKIKLKIDLDEIKKMSGQGAKKKALKYLISKAEDQGIFISKTISYHRIEVEEMRGLFISNDYCPFIVLNRRDTLSAQLFSIVHEFAHLFRKTEAISNSLEFRKTDQGLNDEEVFCNKTSIELFLPDEEFSKSYYNKDDIVNFSVIYKLSTISIFYRLKNLGKILHTSADNLERDLKKESEKYLRLIEEKKKRNKSGGNYINNMKDSNGVLFNRIVANYYFENKVGYTEASNLLNFSVESI